MPVDANFDDLLRQHKGLITFMVGKYGFTKNADEYDDATQAASIAMWMATKTFNDSQGHFGTWAGTWIRSMLIYRNRYPFGMPYLLHEQKRQKSTSRVRECSSLRVVENTPSITSTIEAFDHADEVEVALSALTGKQRKAIELLYLTGCYHREAAATLGCTRRNLGRMAMTALRAMRERMSGRRLIPAVAAVG